jgi:hypothetical protein
MVNGAEPSSCATGRKVCLFAGEMFRSPMKKTSSPNGTPPTHRLMNRSAYRICRRSLRANRPSGDRSFGDGSSQDSCSAGHDPLDAAVWRARRHRNTEFGRHDAGPMGRRGVVLPVVVCRDRRNWVLHAVTSVARRGPRTAHQCGRHESPQTPGRAYGARSSRRAY